MTKKVILFLIDIFFVLLSGLMLGASFYDYQVAWLAYVALVPFFFVLFKAKSYWFAGLSGILLGFVFMGAVFAWIRVIMHWVGPLAMLGWLGLVLYLSIFVAFFSVAVMFFRDSLWQKHLCVPALWITMEWLQAKGIFGVTIANLAYSQKAEWLISQSAAYGGIYLISFIIIISNVLVLDIFMVFKNRFRNSAGYFFWIVLIIFSLGMWFNFLKTHPTVSDNGENKKYIGAVLIQPAIPQEKKLSYDYVKEIEKSVYEQTGTAAKMKADLYILPESIVPGIFSRNEAFYRQLYTLLPRGAVLAFGNDRKENGKYFNSVYSISNYGKPTRLYDKVKIVPFGEYIPYRSLFGKFLPSGSDFFQIDLTAGKETGILTLPDDNYVAGLSICFESIFPVLFYEQYWKGCNFYVVVTNDAWFFDSIALKLHHNATAMRAVESGKQVLFCANTGISATFLPSGKAVNQLEYNKSGFVYSKLYHFSRYTFYYRFFNWIIGLALLILFFAVINRLIEAGVFG